MTRPLFSVIIPTYNRPQILERTLNCLESQRCGFPFEVIVVDDYPEDVLPDLGFGRGERKRWKLIRNNINLGRAATRNVGIRAAKGEYLLFLDDDIWAEPQLLQAHYDKQKEIGGGVVVGAVPVHGDVPRHAVNEHYRIRMRRLHEKMLMEAEDLPYNYFFSGNISLPRIHILKVGMFNEVFKTYSCEDTELGYRFKKYGLRFVYEPRAIGHHYFNESLDAYLTKYKNWGRSACRFAQLHPELSSEISIAGILCPGNSGYQLLLERPILVFSRLLCSAIMKIGLSHYALWAIDKTCLLWYAYGLKAEKRLGSPGHENRN